MACRLALLASPGARQGHAITKSIMLGCRIGRTVLLIVLLLVSSRQTWAQRAPRDDATTAMRSDSIAWQRILVYVVRALSVELVRAAADTAAQPWDVRLPVAEPQRRLLDAQLRTILRARPVDRADSVVHLLELGELRIVGDTALVAARFQETRRCPGSATRTTGSGWSDTARVPRHPGSWGVAFSRRAIVGDRVGC